MMDSMANADSLLRFAPELALGTTLLVLLFADLALKRHPLRDRLLTGLAVLGLVASAGTLFLIPAGDTAIFSGQVALDGFALFFKGLFLAAALLGVLFGALSDEIPRARYGEFLLLLFCLTLGLSLLASAQHLLMVYLALELVSLPSYVLAGFRWWDRRSSEAALKYVIYGGAASGLMLYGFSLIYGLTGSLELAGLGDALTTVGAGAKGLGAQLALLVAVLLSLVGFGYKVAAVPFHMWCPDVYEGAPTPFVAFLSVAPKAAGLAALLRFFVVGFGAPLPDAAGVAAAGGASAFPWAAVLGVLAVGTMTLGNLVAIAQDNVKRLLAYSSIAQAGYLLMTVAAGTPDAIRAVLLYLGIYLLMNMGAFLAVQAIRARTGSESINDYRGMASRSPFLAVTLAIFLFSLTGIPPFAGFIGKFYLFAAVLKVGTPFFYALALIGVLNSAISLYYYAKIVKAMFLEKAPDGAPALPLGRPNATLLGALAAPTLVLGIWWAPLAAVVDRASSLLG